MHQPRKNIRYEDVESKASDASVQHPVDLLKFIIEDVMGWDLDDEKHIYGVCVIMGSMYAELRVLVQEIVLYIIHVIMIDY